MAGQKRECIAILEKLVGAGCPVEKIYTDLFQGALYQIGELWEHLESFLRKIVGLNQIIANRKQIRITLNIPQPIPGLSFDPVKMEQVVNNLLSNAIKYSHAGTTVSIGAFSTDNDVVISIRDEGQGIPAGEIEKLFTPFAKISVASTDGEKSTGLGLSIVKKIINGHRGKIWVESEVGKGSVFYFSLPLKAG